VEELERNKENEPPRGLRRRRNADSEGWSTGDDNDDVPLCPVGFEINSGQAEGFYIPNSDGRQIEPRYIKFVQSPGDPHAEGTQGQGFPFFRYELFAPADYSDTDLPLGVMPIWFTSAVSRHNHQYNGILQAALKHNKWGICADLICYRTCEDQIGIWEARVEEAVQRVERAREERQQARYCLKAARAHCHFHHLECTRSQDDWQYDNAPEGIFPRPQLAHRGRRNIRGRGRPQA
jgi:hypothetical protein